MGEVPFLRVREMTANRINHPVVVVQERTVDLYYALGHFSFFALTSNGYPATTEGALSTLV